MIDALPRVNAAVAGITVHAVEDARSAETFEEKRRGGGVVISEDGLVLTIGYLMFGA